MTAAAVALPITEDPEMTQVGPYQLTPDGDNGWYLIYLEDNEDLDSWDELLTTVPEFGHAYSVSQAVLEVDNVRVIAEHWTTAPLIHAVAEAD